MEPVNSDKSTKCFLLVPFPGENAILQQYYPSCFHKICIRFWRSWFMTEICGCIYRRRARYMSSHLFQYLLFVYLYMYVVWAHSKQSVIIQSFRYRALAVVVALPGNSATIFQHWNFLSEQEMATERINGDNHTDIHYTLIRQNEASQRIRVEKVDIHGQQQGESNAIAHLLWSCWYLLWFAIKSETNKWKK